LKPIFFLQDPEKVHDRMTGIGSFLGKFSITRKIASWKFGYHSSMLEQDILGIHFHNPVGLAAGFDKNAQLTHILPSVGFGFEEVGSVTGEPCEGNPKPRLWRLPHSKALVVYYGLKNDGAEIISTRLAGKQFQFPVGVSVAKTNSPETVDTQKGIADYTKAFRLFAEKNIGDYITINISCPNAYGGEPFADARKLDALLAEIRKISYIKPIFIKMPPDLSDRELDDIIAVARIYNIAGFISTNLTKDVRKMCLCDEEKAHYQRNIGKGGISGKAVEDLSNKQIAYLYKKTKKEFVIIGCGGVFTAEDAYRKIKLGASLLQVITGMIYEGPQLISEINLGLVRLLKKDGFKNISEAIGIENR